MSKILIVEGNIQEDNQKLLDYGIETHSESLKKTISNYTKELEMDVFNPSSEKLDNKINELKFEPSEALYAGDKGLSLIKNLINILPKIIKMSGFAFIEIDPEQSYFFKSLKNFKVEIKKDFNNFDRLVILRLI